MFNFDAKVVKAEWNTKRIHSFLFVRCLLPYLKVVKAEWNNPFVKFNSLLFREFMKKKYLCI